MSGWSEPIPDELAEQMLAVDGSRVSSIRLGDGWHNIERGTFTIKPGVRVDGTLSDASTWAAWTESTYSSRKECAAPWRLILAIESDLVTPPGKVQYFDQVEGSWDIGES